MGQQQCSYRPHGAAPINNCRQAAADADNNSVLPLGAIVLQMQIAAAKACQALLQLQSVAYSVEFDMIKLQAPVSNSRRPAMAADRLGGSRFSRQL